METLCFDGHLFFVCLFSPPMAVSLVVMNEEIDSIQRCICLKSACVYIFACTGSYTYTNT